MKSLLLAGLCAAGTTAQSQLDAAQTGADSVFSGRQAAGELAPEKPEPPRLARDADRLTGYALSGGPRQVVGRLKLAQAKGGLPPAEKWNAGLAPMTRLDPLDAALKVELPMLIRLVEQMQAQSRQDDIPE